MSNKLYAESNAVVNVGKLAFYSAGSFLLAGASAYMANYAYLWAKDTYKQMMTESKGKRTKLAEFLQRANKVLKVCSKSEAVLLCSFIAFSCAYYSVKCALKWVPNFHATE